MCGNSLLFGSEVSCTVYGKESVHFAFVMDDARTLCNVVEHDFKRFGVGRISETDFECMREYFACVFTRRGCLVVAVFRCLTDGRYFVYKLLYAFSLSTCGRGRGLNVTFCCHAVDILCCT